MQKNNTQRTEFIFQVTLKKINFLTQVTDPKVFVSIQLGSQTKNISPRLIRNKFVNFHEIKLELNCEILSPQSIVKMRIITLNKSKQTQIGVFNIDLKILARMMNKVKPEKTQLVNLIIEYDIKLIQKFDKEQQLFQKQATNDSVLTQKLDSLLPQKHKQHLNEQNKSVGHNNNRYNTGNVTTFYQKKLSQNLSNKKNNEQHSDDLKEQSPKKLKENSNKKNLIQQTRRTLSPQNINTSSSSKNRHQSLKNQKELSDNILNLFSQNSQKSPQKQKIIKKTSEPRQSRLSPNTNKDVRSQYDLQFQTQKNLIKKKVSFISQTQKIFQINEEDKMMKHQINELKTQIKQREKQINKLDLVVMICLGLFSFIAGSLIRQLW